MVEKTKAAANFYLYLWKLLTNFNVKCPLFQALSPAAPFFSFFLVLISLHTEFTFVFCSWRKYLRILIVCICERERERERDREREGESRQGQKKCSNNTATSDAKRRAKIFEQFQNAIVKCFKRFLFECGEGVFLGVIAYFQALLLVCLPVCMCVCVCMSLCVCPSAACLHSHVHLFTMFMFYC